MLTEFLQDFENNYKSLNDSERFVINVLIACLLYQIEDKFF